MLRLGSCWTVKLVTYGGAGRVAERRGPAWRSDPAPCMADAHSSTPAWCRQGLAYGAAAGISATNFASSEGE
jgi:hypothetical protein